MPKSSNSDEETGAWGYSGNSDKDRGRTPDEFAELVRRTKLRTLLDMPEREIRALERHYGCPVIRPTKPVRRARTA